MKPMSSSKSDRKTQQKPSRHLWGRARMTPRKKARPTLRDRPWGNRCRSIWATASSTSIQVAEVRHIRSNSIPREPIGILSTKLDRSSDRTMWARTMPWINLSQRYKKVQRLNQIIGSLKRLRRKRRSQMKTVRSRIRRLVISIWQWDKLKMKGSRLIHQACWDLIGALSEIRTTRRFRTASALRIDWIDSMASEVCANLFPDPRTMPIAILAGYPQHWGTNTTTGPRTSLAISGWQDKVSLNTSIVTTTFVAPIPIQTKVQRLWVRQGFRGNQERKSQRHNSKTTS